MQKSEKITLSPPIFTIFSASNNHYAHIERHYFRPYYVYLYNFLSKLPDSSFKCFYWELYNYKANGQEISSPSQELEHEGGTGLPEAGLTFRVPLRGTLTVMMVWVTTSCFSLCSFATSHASFNSILKSVYTLCISEMTLCALHCLAVFPKHCIHNTQPYHST